MRLNTEQLAELTSRVNERRAEFNHLFEELSRGDVRMVCDVLDEWCDEQDAEVVEDYANARRAAYEKGYADGHGIRNVTGPTGATLAKVGIVRIGSDAYGEFDHEGERIAFRITLSDDEANADRYYRGFVDGAAHARGEPPPDRSNDYPDADDHDPCPDIEGVLDDEETHDEYDPDLDFGSDDPNAPATPLTFEIYGDYGDMGDKVAAEVQKMNHAFDGVAAKPIGPTRPSLPDPDVARERLASALAEANANGDGGELAALAGRQPRTLAEVDASANVRKGKPHPQPTREKLLAFLQELSMGGVMPSMAQFETAKPVTWATAQSHLQRLGGTWNDLASEAGLKPNRPGGR